MLLPPTTTKCAIPKDAAGAGMLRAIAYGTEINMAYPPRPTDPKIAWEPEWNLKLRVKSMTTTMLGMSGDSGMLGAGDMGGDEMTDAPQPQEGEQAAPPEEPKKKKRFNPFDAVKDVVKDNFP